LENYLKMIGKQRIQALLDLGWSYRKISSYDSFHVSKEAKVSPGRIVKLARVPTGSEFEPFRHEVEAAIAKGLSAMSIWQVQLAD
jgi:hypothetical protein